MSVANHIQFIEIENVSNKIPEAKKFIAANSTPSVLKKKALADVGNIIHQKSVQKLQKSSATISKPNVTGKTLLKHFNNDLNKDVEISKLKQTDKTQNVELTEEVSNMETIKNEHVEPVCFCHENGEGDLADFMLEDIKLTNKQIDDLALEWENHPTFDAKDKYEIDIKFSEIPDVSCESLTYQLLMEEMVDFEWNAFNDPEPASPYDPMMEDHPTSLCNSYSCYGL